jgi:hypothetical protein
MGGSGTDRQNSNESVQLRNDADRRLAASSRRFKGKQTGVAAVKSLKCCDLLKCQVSALFCQVTDVMVMEAVHPPLTLRPAEVYILVHIISHRHIAEAIFLYSIHHVFLKRKTAFSSTILKPAILL